MTTHHPPHPSPSAGTPRRFADHRPRRLLRIDRALDPMRQLRCSDTRDAPSRSARQPWHPLPDDVHITDGRRMWRPSPPSITDDYDPCVRQTVVALHIDPDLASYVCRLQGRRTANGSEIRVSTCPSGPNGVRPRPTRKQGVRPTSAVTTPARLSSLFAGAKLPRERPGTIALTPPQPAPPSTPRSALPDANAM